MTARTENPPAAPATNGGRRHSSNRLPTEKQFRMLSVLGSTGTVVLAPSRSDWGPLIRRGWVEPLDDDDRSKRCLPPLQITPAGLRALADYLERHPRPTWTDRDRPRQLNEQPSVTRLREKLEAVEQERDRLSRDLGVCRQRLRVIVRTVDREREGLDL